LRANRSPQAALTRKPVDILERVRQDALTLESPTMKSRRPALVLATAITNFAIGGLALLCGCFGSLAQFQTIQARTAGTTTNPNVLGTAYVEQRLPGYTAVEIATYVVIGVGAVVVIADGVGLLLMQSWARWTAIVYSVLVLLYLVGYIIFKVLFVYPVEISFAGWPSGYVPSEFASKFNRLFFLSLAFKTGFLILHAAALLGLMLLPSVIAAFAGTPKALPLETSSSAQ